MQLNGSNDEIDGNDGNDGISTKWMTNGWNERRWKMNEKFEFEKIESFHQILCAKGYIYGDASAFN